MDLKSLYYIHPPTPIMLSLLEGGFEMHQIFTFFVQETFLMQMPGRPPAERQREQRRSSLMGKKCRFSVTFGKVRAGTGAQVKYYSHRTFPKHTRHVSRSKDEPKPRGLTKSTIYPRVQFFNSYSKTFHLPDSARS